MEAEKLTQHIGNVLRSLRKDRRLTLDGLANLTGVSKPMLSQIERGESNPTVVTLWKIASGLQVPFSIFLQGHEEPHATIIRHADQPIVHDDGGNYIVQNLIAIRHPQPTDLFASRLLSGCTHIAAPHGADVTEGVWVKHGELTLILGDERIALHEGDAIHFQANLEHTYVNPGNSSCEFLVLLVYKNRPDASPNH
ncbi:Cro/Cl family transcriptional regulator [Alicyclobacillus acidoterrestris]|uniref:helix-turn-helix domain-containing protein n=1 Tax=Alicyclobacillus suci TaxID=2816080 RepID=UPI001191F764|nr:XRE family transcriptional regulator [Alicyclobacillus suci]GEO24592.1 Cro/Cl family transcriptional regulator [Alicyclobacillus acidoterrestris]